MCIHCPVLNVLSEPVIQTALKQQLRNKLDLFFSVCSDAEGIFGRGQVIHYGSDGVRFYLPFLDLPRSPPLSPSSSVLRRASSYL